VQGQIFEAHLTAKVRELWPAMSPPGPGGAKARLGEPWPQAQAPTKQLPPLSYLIGKCSIAEDKVALRSDRSSELILSVAGAKANFTKNRSDDPVRWIGARANLRKS
jgi:hypothetical protein